jgi:hypothetical protein
VKQRRLIGGRQIGVFIFRVKQQNDILERQQWQDSPKRRCLSIIQHGVISRKTVIVSAM